MFTIPAFVIRVNLSNSNSYCNALHIALIIAFVIAIGIAANLVGRILQV